jgi:lipoprotein Spr
MKKRLLIHTVLAMLACVGCESSEELLHPKSYVLAKKTNEPQANNYPSAIRTSGTTRKPVNPEEAERLQEKYSQYLKATPEEIKSLLLYSFIDEWHGVRYRLGGNDKNGIDCSAFARRLYEEVFGINLLRTSIEQYGICKFFTNKEDLMEGDLVFFRVRGKRISHVGVYLMNGYFVHASISHGVMISNIEDVYWGKRYAGAGYIPK